ncbi:MAG: hypothetical protein ACOC3T_00535 [Bacteroidota bacterium]
MKPLELFKPIVGGALLLLLATTLTYTQDCPPDVVFPENSFSEFTDAEVGWGHGYIDYNETGDNFEVKIDWGSVNNYGKYGLTDEEFKDFFILGVFNTLFDGQSFQGSRTVTFYEESTCYLTQRCWLHVDRETQVLCQDDCWQGQDPNLYEDNDEWYYPVSQIVECGTQCCAFVYTVECTAWEHGWYYNVTNITKSPVTICDPGSETDCLTGNPLPCESNCD